MYRHRRLLISRDCLEEDARIHRGWQQRWRDEKKEERFLSSPPGRSDPCNGRERGGIDRAQVG